MLTDTHTAVPLWEQYRDNFSRHLLGVSRYLQTRMMSCLQRECGHNGLRLSFAPYITALGGQTLRPSALAERLHISRQACNQIIRQIEAAGYITHRPDPTDGRATQLVLTMQGKALRSDGQHILKRLDTEFEQLAGHTHYDKTRRALAKLFHPIAQASANGTPAQGGYQGMGGSLPGLAEHSLQRLMALTRERGHPGLKLCFGQVLTLIGPSGGRIHEIAAIQDVSKQAISNIAKELESLGYLQRHNDPADARQQVLQFSKRGQQLIADSVASVADLESEFTALITSAAFDCVKRTLRDIYHGLQLEQDIFGHRQHKADIPLLAQQLQQQLGHQGSQALAKLLLAR